MFRMHVFITPKNCAYYRRFIVFLFVTSLVACSGWRLRGSDAALSDLNQSVFLSGEPSQTYSLVKAQLERRGRLQPFSLAQLELQLGAETLSRRSVSLSNNNRTAEYQLTLTLPYRFKQITADTVASSTAQSREAKVIRSYRFDENDIAGAQKEETIIQNEMRRLAARQILRQLQLNQP